MEPAARRRNCVKLVRIVLVLLAGLILLMLAGVEWTLTRRWNALESGIRELIADEASRDARRPVAAGGSIPGNAWDDYLKALEEVAARPATSMSGPTLFLARAASADREWVEGEVAAFEKALGHLSQGARKAEARIPLRWEGEALVPHSGEGLLRRLAEIAVCKARLLRERGDARAAADLLLETAQLGRDGACGTSTEMEWESLRALETVFTEMSDLLVSRAPKAADLAVLDQGLRAIDQTLASDGRPLLNDVAFLGTFLLRGDPFIEADSVYRQRRPVLPGPGHLYSMRLLKSDAFQRWRVAARAYAAAGSGAWAESKGVFDRIVNLLERAPENPIVNRLTPPSLETHRARKAQLGLLLMAVGFLREGQVGSHVDPFGPPPEPFLSRIQGGRLRVWSRGPNGVDDEGRVADRPVNTLGQTTIIGPALGAADDIVLEVER